MPYGEIRVDTITFTNGGVDTSISVSGLAASTTGNLTVTGTISGATVRATTVSGVTVTGTTVQGASGTFTSITGGTATITSGLFASGTAANPSIAIIGDANTGLYSPGADQLAISTNGTGRLFVDASGRVGIGGTPSSDFEITSALPSARLRDTTDNSYGEVLNNNGALSIRADEGNVASGSYIDFRVDGSERARLTSDGRLGVGTSSPAVLFHAAGAGLFRGSTTGTEATLPTETTALSVLHGTSYNTTPSCSINIGANNRDAVNNNEGFRWGITTPGDAGGLALAFSSTSWNGSANVTSERLRITDGGNVGIGTTSPGALLHTSQTSAGSSVIGAAIRNNSATASTGVSFDLSPSAQDPGVRSAQIEAVNNGSNQISLNFKLSNAAAPETKLSLSTGGTLTVSANPGGSPFIANIGASEVARIDSSGRLLVGTSSSVWDALVEVARVGGSQFVGHRYGANAFPSEFSFLKSRGASIGTNTIVNDADTIGQISFRGADGSSYIPGASISASVDGTPGTNDMPGRIVFSTTADGASSPTERMRITSAGRVGIGTTAPGSTLDVNGTIRSGNYHILDGSTSAAGIVGFSTSNGPSLEFWGSATAGSGALIAKTAGSERARIDSSGRLLVGTSSSITALVQAGLQVHGIGESSYINSGRWSNDAANSEYIITKSRGATVGTRAIVQSDDSLGSIRFAGDDGTSFVSAARIVAQVDGTPGTNDMPGRLVFSTTADGASSPTERLRITSDGKVGLGTSSPNANLTVAGTDDSTLLTLHGATGTTNRGLAISTFTNLSVPNAGVNFNALQSTAGALRFSTLGTTRMHIDEAGRVGIGTTSPATLLHIATDDPVIRLEDTAGGTQSDYEIKVATSVFQVNNVSTATTPFTVNNSGTTTLTSAASTAPFIANIGASEVARIDSSGRLLVGTSTSRSSDGVTPRYFQEGASTYEALGICSNGGTDPNRAAYIFLGRSRGTTLGSSTIVASGDVLGGLNFYGADGTDLETPAAGIACYVDGTPGTNDMPGRIVFSTTADGASSPTERMRINNAGTIFFGNGETNASPANALIAATGGSGTNITGATLTVQGGRGTGTGAGGPIVFSTAANGTTGTASNPATERARIDSSGRLLIGTSTARANFFNSTLTGDFQVESVGNGLISVVRNSADAFAGGLVIGKTRGSSAGSNVVIQSGDGLGVVSFQGSDGTEFVEGARIQAVVDGTPGANDLPCRLEFSTTADGASSPTERMRITSGGYFKASNDGAYNAATASEHEIRQTANDTGLRLTATNGSYAANQLYGNVVRAANTAYNFAAFDSGNAADREFTLRGDGTGLCDGSWTGGGADYAEYFEWSDANPNAEDRRGISVVLDGEKIRPAFAGEDPIGVISGNPSVVGDAAWNKWSGKYLRDEFGTYILEDYEVEDEDGNTVVQQRRKLNPAYDPDAEYIPREQRPEWDCVGLMGKLRLHKGQPTGSRWIKMRDVSANVEEWLVR